MLYAIVVQLTPVTLTLIAPSLFDRFYFDWVYYKRANPMMIWVNVDTFHFLFSKTLIHLSPSLFLKSRDTIEKEFSIKLISG